MWNKRVSQLMNLSLGIVGISRTKSASEILWLHLTATRLQAIIASLLQLLALIASLARTRSAHPIFYIALGQLVCFIVGAA